MTEVEEQIRASTANGLTKTEIEAFLGRKMTDKETDVYNKTHALLKLQK